MWCVKHFQNKRTQGHFKTLSRSFDGPKNSMASMNFPPCRKLAMYGGFSRITCGYLWKGQILFLKKNPECIILSWQKSATSLTYTGLLVSSAPKDTFWLEAQNWKPMLGKRFRFLENDRVQVPLWQLFGGGFTYIIHSCHVLLYRTTTK